MDKSLIWCFIKFIWWTFKQLVKIPLGLFKLCNFGSSNELFIAVIYFITLYLNVMNSKIIDYFDFGLFLTGVILVVKWNKLSKDNLNMNQPDWIKTKVLKTLRKTKKVKKEIERQKRIKAKDIIIEDIPEKPKKENTPLFKPKKEKIIEVEYKILN